MINTSLTLKNRQRKREYANEYKKNNIEHVKEMRDTYYTENEEKINFKK